METLQSSEEATFNPKEFREIIKEVCTLLFLILVLNIILLCLDCYKSVRGSNVRSRKST